jgi:hypothetical protein
MVTAYIVIAQYSPEHRGVNDYWQHTDTLYLANDLKEAECKKAAWIAETRHVPFPNVIRVTICAVKFGENFTLAALIDPQTSAIMAKDAEAYATAHPDFIAGLFALGLLKPSSEVSAVVQEPSKQ